MAIEFHNLVRLTGRVATEPNVRKTGGGRDVMSFRLAVRHARVGSDDRTSFFDVTVWDAKAQKAILEAGKGSLIDVTGGLRMDQWRTKGTELERVAEWLSQHEIEVPEDIQTLLDSRLGERTATSVSVVASKVEVLSTPKNAGS